MLMQVAALHQGSQICLNDREFTHTCSVLVREDVGSWLSTSCVVSYVYMFA